MEAFIILLVMGIVVVVLVLPIVAMVRSNSTQAQLGRLQEQHEALRLQVELLRRSLEASPHSSLGTSDATTPTLPTPQPARVQPPAPATPPTTPGEIPVSVPGAAVRPAASPSSSSVPRPEPEPTPAPKGPPPIPKPPGPPPPRPKVPAAPAFNWERFVGTQLIAWLGGLVLFLAAAYFIKYSFDHNWVPREVQAGAGFLLGISLIVGGFVLKKKAFAVTSQTFCATGVLILYAVTFGCRAYYHFPLFSNGLTFALMALITASGFLLAIRMEARVVAVLGMLGGFLTPVILGSGEDQALGLFLYIGLLDVGLIAVALVTRWTFLIPLAAAGTVLIELGWSIKFLSPQKLAPATFSQIGFNLLFLAGAEIAHRLKRLDRKWTGAGAGLAVSAMIYAAGMIFERGLGTPLGWTGSIVFVADLCLILLALRQPAWWSLQPLGALLAHAFLGAWMMLHLTSETLFWALGGVLIIALLHVLSPLLIARARPNTPAPSWTHCFPPLALLLMLLPIFKLSEVSILIWPLIFLVDVLAIGLALATRSLISVLAVLLITGVVGVSWIFRIPALSVDLPMLLVVIGAMAILFLFAGMFALRRIVATTGSDPEKLRSAFGGFALTGDQSTEALMTQLPALSALMPFVLLTLIVLHLPLPNPSPVFALAMALTVVLLSIARAFQRGGLTLVALVSVVVLQWLWQGRSFDPAVNASLSLGWHGAFSLLLFLFPFLNRDRFLNSSMAWASAALAFPFHFPAFHSVIQAAWPNPYMGLLPAVLALPMIWAVVQSSKNFTLENPRRNTVLAWFGGAALFFITLIFPIQFDRQWITVSWALEGAALCWLYHRIPHGGLRWTGAGLLGVSFGRLALNPEVLSYHPRSETALLNWYLYSFGLVITALFLAGRLLAPPRDRAGRVRFPAVFYSLGTILLFLLLNVEIADYFTAPGTSVLTFQFQGNFARDMSYTIGWGVFALGLVSAGMWWAMKAARYAGLALMGVTLLKLFLHDLSQLGPLYRIGALAGVALVAILASVLYQKFVATEDKKNPSPEPPST